MAASPGKVGATAPPESPERVKVALPLAPSADQLTPNRKSSPSVTSRIEASISTCPGRMSISSRIRLICTHLEGGAVMISALDSLLTPTRTESSPPDDPPENAGVVAGPGASALVDAVDAPPSDLDGLAGAGVDPPPVDPEITEFSAVARASAATWRGR